MNYFRLRHSLLRDNVGHYPQASEVRYHCPQWNLPGSNNPMLNSASGFEPVTKAILHSKAIATDLISVLNTRFCDKLLISSRLKSIIVNHSSTALKFEPAELVTLLTVSGTYWLTSAPELSMDFIDFANSEVILRHTGSDGKPAIRQIKINDLQHFFISAAQANGNLLLNRIAIKPSVSSHFFKIRHTETDCEYLVSETLKLLIESACTGAAFQPAGYSTRQWLNMGYQAARDL